MSFPRYAKYKESGVKGLGEVPEHWRCVPLKSIASLNDEVLGEDTPSDFAIEYVEISDVEIFLGITGSTATTFAEAPSRARRKVRDGDVIVSTVRTYLKAIAQVRTPPDNMIVSTGFAVVRPKSADSGFLGYLLRSDYVIGTVISRSVGISYPAINSSDLSNIILPLPPFGVQSEICNFLDRETAKIDALVAEQERLIALLKEKRQAVISHAVTKGLDPNAPMKDSGVEWLGEVPAHWAIARLKRATILLKDGTHLPPQRVDEGVPLLSVRNIADGKFGLRDDYSQISEADYAELSRAFVPQPNDVLLAIVGATLGKVALIPADLGKFHIQRSVAVLRTSPIVQPEWLRDVISSGGFQRLLWEHVGYSAQPGIYLGTLADFCIPVPSLGEQSTIATHLRSATGKLDRLIAEAQRAIALLQERRAALISAAVTGKIDVRGLVAADAEAA